MVSCFELEVCDYLLKPFRFDRFLKAVNRALAMHTLKIKAGDPIPAAPVSKAPAQIYIKSDKKLVLPDLDAVYYLESLGNYVKVWEAEEAAAAGQKL